MAWEGLDHPMRLMPVLAVLAAAVLLAGCAASQSPTTVPASTAPQASGWAWHGYDLRQCEQPMWATGQPGGDDAAARDAELVRMAREHYAAKGATITDGRVTRDGGVYPAACGLPSGQRVHLNVTGDASALTKDNWSVDQPTWYRFTVQQCEQPVWSPGPPTSGNAQDAWADQARAHYEAKGVRILDDKTSFTEMPPMACGQPSNFHVHLQLAPAEDPAPLVADEWEVERGSA